MNMTSRPLIQDLVKEALSKDARAAAVAAEGARQVGLSEGTSKEASASVDTGEETVSTEFATKLASAVEYALPEIVKAASIQISGGGRTNPAAPPPGVSASQQSQTQIFTPSGQGKGHAQPPVNPPEQKAVAGAATQLANTAHHHVPGTQTTAMSGGQGKTAGVSDITKARLAKVAGVKAAEFPPKKDDGEKKDDKGGEKKAPPFAKKDDDKKEASAPATLVDHFLTSTKVAEDAINPAKISAGAAVPPDTSASEEPGGQPVAGAPQGPSSLVGSNESARNYKKGTAYAPRKAELKKYFNEPALTSSTDSTLQKAFAHTGEAGVKISSAGQVKTAAARALLKKMAESTAKKAG